MELFLTYVGIVFALAPFALLAAFKNKTTGFFTILFFTLFFHTSVALLTQAFHIFQYSTILSVHAVTTLGIILYLFLNFSNTGKLKTLKNKVKNIDWTFLAVVIITASCLFAVHYDYSGKYNKTNSLQYLDAEHMTYPYPYFADEWYAIAFINDSINTRGLPLQNSLDPSDRSFVNVQFPFHSTLAQLFMLLELDPVIHYTLFSLVSGVLIVALLYLFLRGNAVRQLPAGIVSLCALYVVNGANLPGLWMLIPITFGIIAFLIGLFFISQNKLSLALLATVLIAVYYPPLILFYLPALLVYRIGQKNTGSKQLIYQMALFIIIVICSGALLSVAFLDAHTPWYEALPFVVAKLYYISFLNTAIPQFSIFTIVPPAVLVFALFGVNSAFRKIPSLVCAWLLGLLFWLIYSATIVRFGFGYERIVFIASLMTILIAGFGLHTIIEFIRPRIQKQQILLAVQIAILLFFVVLVPSYTKRETWMKLVAIDNINETILLPAAPANKYFTFSDFALFAPLRGERFLSDPWKGTVVGVATQNYPVTTKPGTITVNLGLYRDFILASCDKKREIASAYNIDYVYTPPFTCGGFERQYKSTKGLSFYKVIKN